MNLSTSQRIQTYKTITWTVLSMVITFVVTWIITGSWEFGISVSVSERVIKVVVYYIHERYWHKKYKIQKRLKGTIYNQH